MSSEHKVESLGLDIDEVAEGRDYTKWVWFGVIALFVVLGAVLYTSEGISPSVSTVRVRHILISFNDADPTERAQALTKIREIRDRVLQGEDFGKLARDYSNDPGSASKGGDLGYVQHAILDPKIDGYIWTAPIGQLSEIIQTRFGFHIVVVDDRRLSEADAFEERKRQQAEAPKGLTTAPPTQNQQ
ncbi:MAG: peptidyl-prolyl cis-trans isomerase [Candidatus Hydrogenedentes bacterium]|nr:peptidyl-prolyl cis-trans isomerase [Candidatus Hydrogenedentota bacterium]